MRYAPKAWVFAAVAAISLCLLHGHALIVFNPSRSMPVGFYIRADQALRLGAIVTVRADHAAPAYARARRFTGPSHLFIKRIAALAGDRVCASRLGVSINEARRVGRSLHDHTGALLPTWLGCQTLGVDEVFLLGDSVDSFDGRYWGPLRRNLIEAQWRPLFILAAAGPRA